VYGGYLKMKEPQIFLTFEGGGYSETVQPESAGQYTGLKDDNGVKIFEGDIVGMPEKEDWDVLICWDGGFKLRYKDGSDNWISELTDPGSFIISGNIHDNPELLEARDEKN
jgi:uncharacterized phage protein (TIGR01671 family)